MDNILNIEVDVFDEDKEIFLSDLYFQIGAMAVMKASLLMRLFQLLCQGKEIERKREK